MDTEWNTDDGKLKVQDTQNQERRSLSSVFHRVFQSDPSRCDPASIAAKLWRHATEGAWDHCIVLLV